MATTAKTVSNDTRAVLLNALRIFTIRNNGETNDDFGWGCHDGISTENLARIAGTTAAEARAALMEMSDGDQREVVGEAWQPDCWVIGGDALDSVLDELGIYVDDDVSAGDGWSGGMVWRLPDDVTDDQIIQAFETVEAKAACDDDDWGLPTQSSAT